MTFFEALVLARDEGHWIRSVKEGEECPHRWIWVRPGQSGRHLSYRFADRDGIGHYIPPYMGTIEELFGDWETMPPPNEKKRKRRTNEHG